MSDIFTNGFFRGVEIAFPVWVTAVMLAWLFRVALVMLGLKSDRG